MTARTVTRRFTSIAGAALLFTGGIPAQARTSYTFTPVASSTGAYQGFEDLSLNEWGQVAFSATLDNGARGIYTGADPRTSRIVETGGVFSSIWATPSLNDNGAVAFIASLRNGASGVFRVSAGGVVTPIADSSGPVRYIGSNPTLNNAGAVAFVADMDSGGPVLFRGDGGALTRIAEATGSILNFNIGFEGGDPIINDSGTVAFCVRRTNGTEAVYTGSGGPLTTIATTMGPYAAFRSVNQNNPGTVAFVGALDSGTIGVYTGANPATSRIVDSSGIFWMIGGAPSINDAGQVAFLGLLDAGGRGIYTGPLASDRLIGTGDMLFGSRINEIFMNPTSLNNRGQIAFQVRLANGSQHIVLANPVPEPGTLALLATAAAAGALSRRRSPRR